VSVSSSSPRRQRKALYTADSFERRVRMGVPLSRELRARFRRRTLPLRKGDTVRVLAGSFVGREERVAKVHRRSYRVTLDNVTLKTAEEKLKPLTLGVGNLVITRLNLSDPWRRRMLRVRDEDVTAEERGETPEEPEEEAPESAVSPEASKDAKSVEPKAEPDTEVEDDSTEDAESPAAPSKAATKAAKEEDEK
jgi:large subunit ribosomal protein L24